MAHALVGGICIGLAAGVVFLLLGRIAGVTGIVAGAGRVGGGHSGWRLAFLIGLVTAGAIGTVTSPGAIVATGASPGLAITGGLLVGFGARYGGGCTSGHGVCGMGRLSRRSIVGCATFMVVAMAVVFVMRHGVAW